MPAFNDTAKTYLPAVGSFSDGSLQLLDPATFQLSPSDGTITVEQVTQDVPIPGTNLILKSGANIYVLQPVSKAEDVVITPSGFPNGVTVEPFTVSEAAPPPQLTSVGFAPFQP